MCVFYFEQHRAAGAQVAQLARFEQTDHAVFAVVTRLADYLPGAQPRDRFGEQRGRGAGNIFDRHRVEDRKLRPECRDQPVVAALDRLARRAGGVDLRQHLRQRHQVLGLPGGRRRQRLLFRPIGQHFDPVQHANGDPLAAHRTAAVIRQCLARGEPRRTFAVAVEVILALFGKELDRAGVARARLERAPDGEVIHVAVEGGRLAAELAGRMGVRVRHQAVAVEHGEPPVHRRVRGEAGLDRENLRREVAVAFGDRIESRLRPERREPRRPNVRGH